MSTIHKRGKIWYIQYFKAGVKFRNSLKTSDKVVAQRKKAQFDLGMSGTSPAGMKAVTLENALALFL